MKIMSSFTMIISLFAFVLLVEFEGSVFSFVQEVSAAVEGSVFILRKPAKLHLAPSGPSTVIEIVWKDNICIWLDKQGAWVQVRMKETGHVGWIHHKYLAPASMDTGVVEQ